MAGSNALIARVKMFEFYARRVWPLHRRFVRHRIARRCLHCIASERMIPLGVDLICEQCAALARSHTPNERDPQGAAAREEQARFDAILAAHQGAGAGQYDALVLFSGGKDSVYMIRRLNDQFPKLRVLAMTLNNGYMSPVALENIDDLIVRLNTDHVFVRPRSGFYKKLFRYCITHLNSGGGYGTVDFSDGEFLLDSARTLAAEKKIPLILAGYSRYQVQDGLHLPHFESPRERELQDRSEVAGMKLAAMFAPEEVALWWHASRHPPGDVARLLFPMYVWDLAEDAVKAQVAQWGLLSRRSGSPVITNHQLIPLLGVVDVHQFGYSSFETEFCRMVREGRARKEDWLSVFELLEYTAQTGLFVKPLVLHLLADLSLSPADVGVHFK